MILYTFLSRFVYCEPDAYCWSQLIVLNVALVLVAIFLPSMNGGMAFSMNYATCMIRYMFITSKLEGNMKWSKTPHQNLVYFWEELVEVKSAAVKINAVK